MRCYSHEPGNQNLIVLIYSFNHASIDPHYKPGFIAESQLHRKAFTNAELHDELYFEETSEEFDKVNRRPEQVSPD